MSRNNREFEDLSNEELVDKLIDAAGNLRSTLHTVPEPQRHFGHWHNQTLGLEKELLFRLGRLKEQEACGF